MSQPPRRPLPVDQVLPDVVRALAGHGAAVLVAPPGAGKTTRVPPALLDAGVSGSIVVLQPRRIAARATAARMAAERGGHVGGEVGYAVRFDRKIGPKTRIEVLTEGLLTRRMQADPFLEGVGCVILDEFHERSLHADLALALLADLRADARPDLGVLVMSATLDAAPVAAFLGGCPVIRAEGRAFPVAVSHVTRLDKRPLEAQVADAVAELVMLDVGGHVLVFLPGRAEIARCARELGRRRLQGDLAVLPLHGGLSPREQDRALGPSRQTKVLLATNVAETSLTVEGVTGVVDSGLVRQPRLDHNLGVARLETVRVSVASATQRAGRAGRTAPGRCTRLWTAFDHQGLRPFDPPALRREDLTRLCLEVRAWGSDPARFNWFESPPAAATAHAEATLRALGAVDAGGLTEVGRRLAALPLPPRLGRVMLAGVDAGEPELAASLAALASERDLLRQPPDVAGDDDLALRLAVLDAVDAGQARGAVARRFGADPRTLEQALATRAQLLRAVGAPRRGPEARSKAARRDARPEGGDSRRAAQAPSDRAAVAALLLAGFPDRVAVRRAPRSATLRLAGGRGATLDPKSVVRDAPLLLAVSLTADQRKRDPVVRMAVALTPADLPTHEALGTRFDPETEAVVQVRELRYGDLALAERPAGRARDADAIAACLAEAARRAPGRALRLDEDGLAALRRIRWLAHARPDLNLPTFPELDDGSPRTVEAEGDPPRATGPGDPAAAQGAANTAALDLWSTWCVGRRSFAELRRLPHAQLLVDALPWAARQRLERDAPTQITLPCGVHARVRYPEVSDREGPAEDASAAVPAAPPGPVVSAKAQHFFGLEQTPTFAGVPARCELLAPNGRPTQVTSDLRGFWQTTWLDVRKDLRGRYPKHPWPEVPTVEDARKGRRKPGR